MNEKIIALIRTAVPSAWGIVVAWLIANAPWLPAEVTNALASDVAQGLLVAVAIAAWYAAARWLESRPWIPDWFVRAILGSAQPPRYSPVELEPIDAPPFIEDSAGVWDPTDIGDPTPLSDFDDGTNEASEV